MTYKLVIPSLEGQPFAATLGDSSVSIAEWGVEPEPVSTLALYGGRINVVDGMAEDAGVGTAIPRSDGKSTLDLRNVIAGTTALVQIDGRPVEMVVAPMVQAGGHPTGEHYYLAIGPNNRFICEPGARHKTLHISTLTGKSRAQIAAAETAAGRTMTESQVTGAWLLANTTYGATPSNAIAMDAFLEYFKHVHGSGKLGRSDHYLFECGGDYTALNVDSLAFNAAGEDELHPLVFRSYGTGDRPALSKTGNGLAPPYTVWQDVQMGSSQRYGYAIALDHITIPKSLASSDNWLITIRGAQALRPWLDAPKQTTQVTSGQYAGDVIWTPNGNHTLGVYMSNSRSVIVEGAAVDHAGHAPGYDYRARVEFPMPMTMFSHDLYFSGEVKDITSRYNWLSRASSCSHQFRSGVHAEGNFMWDNNIGTSWNSFNGDRQFINALDNVIMQAGYRRVAHSEGGYNWGYAANGPLTAMKGNIAAHMADPDDAADLAAKTSDWYDGVSPTPRLVEDTQVWRWGSASKNVSGLDTTVLNQTTMQRYVGAKLGKAFATDAEIVAWFSGAPSIEAAVREAVAWVKDRFGKPMPNRTAPASVTFRPDPDFEGFRWDNRYNWSTMDLPGTNVADSADLDGHFVRFGTKDLSIAALSLGGGTLDMTSGRLQVGTILDGGTIQSRISGQLLVGAASGPLSVEATSGRVAFSGEVTDLDLRAGGHEQILLGPDCTVPSGRSIVLSSLRSRVGWDGTGTATLTIGGSLVWRKSVTLTVSGPWYNQQRRSHEFMGWEVVGSVSGFRGRIAAVDKFNAATFKVCLSDVEGTPVPGDVFSVVLPLPDSWETDPADVTVVSVDSTGVAPLQIFKRRSDDPVPTVAASVVLEAGSTVTIPSGLSSQDLTGPGVTVTNNGATLPAGVSVTGGKLVLVV